jgi:hypothetical protein
VDDTEGFEGLVFAQKVTSVKPSRGYVLSHSMFFVGGQGRWWPHSRRKGENSGFAGETPPFSFYQLRLNCPIFYTCSFCHIQFSF